MLPLLGGKKKEPSLNPPVFQTPPFYKGGARRAGGFVTHLPYDHKLVERAKELRKHMTKPESKLWYEYLRNFKYRVFRQRPIDHYIVDFYCPRLKLVIEIDGETHFTEEGKQYDEERTTRLESYGLRVLRFLNTDVMKNLEGVCERIEGESLRPSGHLP